MRVFFGLVLFFFNFLVLLGLQCCTGSSLVVSGGCSLVVSRVLIAVASLVEEHGL